MKSPGMNTAPCSPAMKSLRPPTEELPANETNQASPAKGKDLEPDNKASEDKTRGHVVPERIAQLLARKWKPRKKKEFKQNKRKKRKKPVTSPKKKRLRKRNQKSAELGLAPSLAKNSNKAPAHKTELVPKHDLAQISARVYK